MQTNGTPLYLKQNVQVEPLIDRWYAWPHLIPPGTAARNITERHMRIMDSYVSAPQIHAAAVKNPKMLGGPFIDYGGKRVNEIKALRDRIKTERVHLFELSEALSTLDALLRENAKGFSLQPLYASVPPILRGLVELAYDLNNNASFRLIEPLLYKTKYYDRSAQSLMLSLTDCDDRPFVLSTPRLDFDGCVHLPLAFDDEVVDELFKLKHTPRSWSDIKDLLGIHNGQEEASAALFTPEPPKPYEKYRGAGVRWRYFGHACILIETSGMSILFDPVLSYTYDSGISRYTYEHLPESIDYVLITHNHQDHVLFETLLQIRHHIKTIVVPRNGPGNLQDPSLKLLLNNCGFHNVIELGEIESIEIEDGEIRALPFLGEHADLDIRTKAAYCLKLGGHALVFAADSCNIEPALYSYIHQEIGDVDALFLGMECDGAPLSWLYGPLMSRRLERGMDESRRLAGSDYEEAISIVDQFKCKEVYVYAMGQEPWLNYIMSLKYTDQSRPIIESNRLISECQNRGLTAERLFGEKEILLG